MRPQKVRWVVAAAGRHYCSYLWNNVSRPANSLITNSTRTMDRSRGNDHPSGPPISHRGCAQPRASRSRSAPAVFRDGSATGRTTSVVRSENRRTGSVPLVGMPWRWPVASLSTAAALCDTPVSDPRAVYAVPTRTPTFGFLHSGFTILPPCAQGRADLLGRSDRRGASIQRGWYSGNGVYIPSHYSPWVAYLSASQVRHYR